MMNKVANEGYIIDIYSDTLIQSLFLGMAPSGDEYLWYLHMEISCFLDFLCFVFFFCFPKVLPVASKALPTTFEALMTASEAFSATSKALSATSKALSAASDTLSALSSVIYIRYSIL